MRTLLGVAALAVLTASPNAAGCLFGSNDYCISCPNKAPFKEVGCPGGEVGLIAKGIAYPGCGVGYYDQRSCKQGSAPKIVSSVTKGDEVVITIKKADIQQLVASGAPPKALGSIGSR
jgi:hypothetical protein